MTSEIIQYNARLYDELWSYTEFHAPEVSPWWPMMRELSAGARDRLEIGPGLFPHLPLQGTHVVDLADRSLDILRQHGAIPHRGLLQDVAFPADSFDLVGLFDVIEHIDDDEAFVGELARITRPGGYIVACVPLGMRFFSAWDRYVGHARRYEPEELKEKLRRGGFEIERFEVHDDGADSPLTCIVLPLLFRMSPRIGMRLMVKFAMRQIHKLKIEWHDVKEWDARLPSAQQTTVICRRI